MIKTVKAWAIITTRGRLKEPTSEANISLTKFPKINVNDDEIQVPCTISYEFKENFI